MALRKVSELFKIQQVTPPHFKVFQSETPRSLLHLCEVQHKRYHLAVGSGNLQSDRFLKHLLPFIQQFLILTKINMKINAIVYRLLTLIYEPS